MSPEAEEELRRMERENDLHRMEEEVVWPQIVIAISIVVVLWALDKVFIEPSVKEQEKVEYKQKRLAEPKFTEM